MITNGKYTIAWWCSVFSALEYQLNLNLLRVCVLGNGKKNYDQPSTIDITNYQNGILYRIPQCFVAHFHFVTCTCCRFCTYDFRRRRRKRQTERERDIEHILYIVFVMPFIRWQFRWTSLHPMLINFIEHKSSNSLITFGNNMRIVGKNNGFATNIDVIIYWKIHNNQSQRLFRIPFLSTSVFVFDESMLDIRSVFSAMHHQQSFQSTEATLLFNNARYLRDTEHWTEIHFNDSDEFRREIVYCVSDWISF